MTDHIAMQSVTFATSTSSASGLIPNALGKSYVKILNASTSIGYVMTGAGSATATATGQYVGPNQTVTFEKPASHDFVAMILDTGTGKCVAAIGSSTNLQ